MTAVTLPSLTAGERETLSSAIAILERIHHEAHDACLETNAEHNAGRLGLHDWLAATERAIGLECDASTAAYRISECLEVLER